ncbi:alpha/beta hydrolase [Microbacterium sp. p3-SID336]|uniref:alpha/beta hydrolase n=1 Tax=Microbacterium sp. p3-SID336 TaxID=2916212 RepID=UPI0021A609C5|nr:alpha/beta hydrolase [Microbacterium sp. p3-SID336]MCT1478866.1 alpha/beta hydrolase [Microbacterium sp. p3-SID336]
MHAEVLTLNADRNVTLTAYLQPADGEFAGVGARPAVVILPGGGYSYCSDREADPVAYPFLAAGYQAFVLRYSTGEHGAWPHPLDDYEQAMALIADNADAWHLDPAKVAVIGFSAGGHLAAVAATTARHRPAAAVLGYPVIRPDIVDACQPGMPYPAEHVTADTAPCFLFHTRDDETTVVENTLLFATALAGAGVPFEAHVYAYGSHGFSTGAAHLNARPLTPRARSWVPESIAWLDDVLGPLTAGGIGEPVRLAVTRRSS